MSISQATEQQSVTIGIPQGSDLGPLLFVIYINYLSKHVNSTVYMYSDDTKIYGITQSMGDMIEVYKIINEIYDSKTTGNILKYRDKYIHH